MSAPLWTGADFLAATGGRPVGDLPAEIGGLSIDTRTLEEGDAFFAIRGERFDGHEFVSAAVAAGAGVLVVSEQKLPALGKVVAPLVVVTDVLQALEKLAAAARARSTARIVAVTGSVGKTTTKEALRHALGACGSVHASSASFNNHWGVPLSLARLPADTRFAVFEIGMNHPGEIRPLVKLVRPHVAIVTLIAAAHLGFFRDLEEIATAKAEIFEGVEPGGSAILNADDPHCGLLSDLARRAGVTRVATFGEMAGADFRLAAYAPRAEGSMLSASIDGYAMEVALAAPGRHIAMNVLAVLGACHLSACDAGEAAAALGSWRAGKGRGARHLVEVGEGTATLLDESYNANPASMRAALAVLGSLEPGQDGRRIAVLGDMLELGSHSQAEHAELAGPVREAGVDALFLAGNEMKSLEREVEGKEGIACSWLASIDELRASLLAYLRPGDVVMIKASNSIGFSKVVDSLTRPSGARLAAGEPDMRMPIGGDA